MKSILAYAKPNESKQTDNQNDHSEATGQQRDAVCEREKRSQRQIAIYLLISRKIRPNSVENLQCIEGKENNKIMTLDLQTALNFRSKWKIGTFSDIKVNWPKEVWCLLIKRVLKQALLREKKNEWTLKEVVSSKTSEESDRKSWQFEGNVD